MNEIVQSLFLSWYQIRGQPNGTKHTLTAQIVFFYLLCFTICSFIAPAPSSSSNIPNHELQALKDLYEATDGPNWHWYSFNVSGEPWNFSVPDPNPCSGNWQGIRCSVGLNTKVVALELAAHELRGQLPESIGIFSEMVLLDLGANHLVGEIPYTLGNLTSLKVLDLNTNDFYNSLPDSVGNLSSLVFMYMANARLNGTLPGSISQLSNLYKIDLALNSFTGTIPEVFGQLPNLGQLYLFRNQLEGTIPYSLGLLPNINNIELYFNQLTGTIPSSFGIPDNLLYLAVGDNMLTGTIPYELGNTSALLYLDFGSNEITGTIPAVLGNLYELQSLYMFSNQLVGTLPNTFVNLSQLVTLEVNDNLLSGTVPPWLGNMTALQLLFINSNFYTGTIPSDLSKLTNLTTLNVAYNMLKGTLPNLFFSVDKLVGLYLDSNYLHGSIPECIGQLNELIYLYLNHNDFSGPIPASFTNLTAVTSIFMQSNMLTGPLTEVFNATTQRFLTTVQVSDNLLTGPLPLEAFKISQLATFVAVENCFTGSIPEIICGLTNLRSLVLDGLHSASSCRQIIMPRFSRAYLITEDFYGTIPECLYHMPKLNTLHVSGNDLVGTLPENLELTGNLLDISLSHNRLYGIIPRQIQQREWYSLDLSYNRIGGTLRTDFATEPANLTLFKTLGLIDPDFNRSSGDRAFIPSLLLRNNRISHLIPDILESYLNISILSGNLFTCNLDESDLPPHDTGVRTYQCGSNSFNISYYAWLTACGLLILGLLLCWYWRALLDKYLGVLDMLERVKRWYYFVDSAETNRAKVITVENDNTTSTMENVKYVFLVSDHLGRISVWSTVFVLVVLLPLNIFVSHFYGTHTYEYAWTVSGAFLSGYVPLSLQLCLFFVLMCMVCLLIMYAFRRFRAFRNDGRLSLAQASDFEYSVMDVREEEDKAESKYSSLTEKVTVYIAFVLINLIIVVGVNVGYVYVAIYQPSSYLVLAQIALSIFKLLWNNLCVLYLIRFTHHYLASTSQDEWKSKGAGFFAIQLFVSLLNYIAIPCLVVAVVSPNCFNNILVAAPTVQSLYYYQACEVYLPRFGCVFKSPRVETTTYVPPFTYSFECSASIMSYYAPTFVYLSFIVIFVIPAVEIAGYKLYNHARKHRNTIWFEQLHYWVPLVLHTVTNEDEDENTPYDILNPYLDANLLLVTIVSYLAILLTFGQVFPPLAMAMLAAIYGMVVDTRLQVGRFLLNATEQNKYKYMSILDAECRGVGSIPKLRQAVRLVVSFACLFYTPFLYDTLGDAVGFNDAYWILIVLPMIPVLLYVSYESYIFFRRRQFNHRVSIMQRQSQQLTSRSTSGKHPVEGERQQPPGTGGRGLGLGLGLGTPGTAAAHDAAAADGVVVLEMQTSPMAAAAELSMEQGQGGSGGEVEVEATQESLNLNHNQNKNKNKNENKEKTANNNSHSSSYDHPGNIA